MEFTEIEKISTVTSISIFYRQIDDIYFGQLSVEKSNPFTHRTLSEQLNGSKNNSTSSGSSCLFQLGNKMLTKK
jgi:hypothetical protein